MSTCPSPPSRPRRAASGGPAPPAVRQEAGLASGLYELNRAVALALATPDAPQLWARREDPLVKAKVADFEGFDPAAFAAAAVR